MKNVLAILSLLVLGGAVWLLWNRGAPVGPTDPYGGGGREAATDPEEMLGADSPALSGRAGAADDRPRGTYPRGRHPTERHDARTGTLEVLPVGPDGEPLSADDITVHALTTRAVAGAVQGLRDRASGLWTFTDVPIGSVRIRVFGDQVAEAEDKVLVREGVTTHAKVAVMHGASVKYAVSHVDGEAPKQVTMQLLDERGRPAQVRWQVRTEKVLTTPVLARTATQGPIGYVLAIRPGSYVLKARVSTGESAEREVVLAPGDREVVRLVLRR